MRQLHIYLAYLAAKIKIMQHSQHFCGLNNIFQSRFETAKNVTDHTMRKNLPKTLDQLIFCKYTLNVLKSTKYLVNDHKFTKYLVNSYQQKGVKHYDFTN